MEFDRRSALGALALSSLFGATAEQAAASSEGHVVVIAELVSKPEKAAALRDLMVPFAAGARKEPGCLRYELLEISSEPGHFLTVETWENQAAIDAHMTTPAIQAAVPLLTPILAKPFTQLFLTSLSV